jgi:hypothetical protein
MQFPDKIYGLVDGNTATLRLENDYRLDGFRFMLDQINPQSQVAFEGDVATLKIEDFTLLDFGYLPDESENDVAFVLNDDLNRDICDKGRYLLDFRGRGEVWRSILERYDILVDTL